MGISYAVGVALLGRVQDTGGGNGPPRPGSLELFRLRSQAQEEVRVGWTQEIVCVREQKPRHFAVTHVRRGGEIHVGRDIRIGAGWLMAQYGENTVSTQMSGCFQHFSFGLAGKLELRVSSDPENTHFANRRWNI